MDNLIDMQAYRNKMRKRHIDEIRIRIQNLYKSVDRIDKLMHELDTKYKKGG